jgi:hypothetical protein
VLHALWINVTFSAILNIAGKPSGFTLISYMIRKVGRRMRIKKEVEGTKAFCIATPLLYPSPPPKKILKSGAFQEISESDSYNVSLNLYQTQGSNQTYTRSPYVLYYSSCSTC